MESRRQIIKLKKYIQSSKVSKLKTYVKRKAINLKTLRLDTNNNTTLLHLACSTSNPRLSLIRYLLRQGIDPLKVNEFNETALHIACHYVCSDEEVCDKDREHGKSNLDVIRKLIKACPTSVDCKNFVEVTPREMLSKYEEFCNISVKRNNTTDSKGKKIKNQKQSDKKSKPNSDNFIYVSECSSSSEETDEKTRWSKRLFKETLDETLDEDDHWGSEWNENDEGCSGTYTDWSNRMSEEYTRKHNSRYDGYLPSHHSKNLPNAKPSSSSRSIPKISEANRREFDRKMAESASQLRGAIEARRHVKLLAARAEYESNWEKLISSKSKSTLQYCDIPWPHLDNSGGANEVAEFLFFGMVSGTDEYRAYLRRQRVRWHPDRFAQRCAERLEDGLEKTRIIYKVTEISKVLNALCRGD